MAVALLIYAMRPSSIAGTFGPENILVASLIFTSPRFGENLLLHARSDESHWFECLEDVQHQRL
jgi:hypothetical protein